MSGGICVLGEMSRSDQPDFSMQAEKATAMYTEGYDEAFRQ